MHLTRLSLVALVLLILAVACPALAERQPADAYRLDVTAFGAVPDDGKDDWAAITAAIQKYSDKDTTLFFPDGVFQSNKPLEGKRADGRWAARLTYEFESAQSVLKLTPGSPGFGDPNKPQSFIVTGSINGSGVEAFQNNIIGPGTIDCRGNPGARCVDFLGNNQASMRDITVLSDGPSAVYLGRAYPGPALIERVHAVGGAVGFQMGHNQYSVTFLDVSAVDYTTAGLDFAGTGAFVDGFVAASPVGGAVPVKSSHAQGYLVLLAAELGCASTARAAIEVNASAVYLLRDISSSGCAGALRDGGVLHVEDTIGEMVSTPVEGNLGTTLNLKSSRPPEPFTSSNPADWVNPLDHGAGNGVGGESKDDVAGIQAAMNAGPIVYYPKLVNGDHSWFSFMGGTVNIPRTVRRVLMNGIEHRFARPLYQKEGGCVYRIDEGTEADPPLEIEYFRRWVGNDHIYPGSYFCVTSRRKVIFRRVTSASVTAEGPGEIYLLDFLGLVHAKGRGRRVYAWQHNSEWINPPGTTLVSDGAEARVIGYKTERDFEGGRCESGARCEVLGAFMMPCVLQKGVPAKSTGWVARNAELSFSAVQHCGNPIDPGKLFPVIVSHDELELRSLSLPNPGGGNRRILPLYSGASNKEND